MIFTLNLRTIQNSEVKALTTSVLKYVMTNPSIQDECIKLLPTIIVNSSIELDWLRDNILIPSFDLKKNQHLLEIFVDIVSLSMRDTILLKSKNQIIHKYFFISPLTLLDTECICDSEIRDKTIQLLLNRNKKFHGVLLGARLNDSDRLILQEIIQKYIPIITDPDINCESQLILLENLPYLIKNVKFMLKEEIFTAWLKILSSPDAKVMCLVPNHIKLVTNQIKASFNQHQGENFITKEKFEEIFRKELIKSVNQAHNSQDADYQENVVCLLENFTKANDITESEILHCFRFALRFLIKSTSKVKYQGYNAVRSICLNFNVKPWQVII